MAEALQSHQSGKAEFTLHAVDAYNQYVAGKMRKARGLSIYQGTEESSSEHMHEECINFVRLFNLQSQLGAPRSYQPSANKQEENKNIENLWLSADAKTQQTIHRCVEIIHRKYQIDVTHGVNFIKAQWMVECGGSNDALYRQTALRMFSSVTCIMLTAARINGVNQIDTCDDPNQYWTLTDLLSRTADPSSGLSAERIEQALENQEDMLAVKTTQKTQEVTGARIFENNNSGVSNQANAGQQPNTEIE